MPIIFASVCRLIGEDDDDDDMDSGRGFDVLNVSRRCGVQLAESRFGPDVRDGIRLMLQEPWGAAVALDDDDDDFDAFEDEEDEDDNFDEIGAALGMDLGDGSVMDTDLEEAASDEDSSFPHMARARLNLTAISQRYNLYFVAYRDEIHVFQPRRAPSILGRPDLILEPRPSRAALMVGGYLDRAMPHQFNHIIVGELGDHEILLMATDDGDIIAYYTHRIAKYIERCGSRGDQPCSPRRDWPRGTPREFFHENVGISAWGLAIHKQSRLIAVSSNHHEVTVFAFALTGQKRDDDFDGDDLWGNREEDKESFKEKLRDALSQEKCPMEVVDPSVLCEGQTAWELQKHFRSRSRNWRIVLPLASDAENLPNVAFCDDDDGNADKVVGIDISGVLWLVDIWLIASQPVRVPTHDRLYHGLVPGHQPVRGWAVMPLYSGHFKPTKSVKEALGTRHEVGPNIKRPGSLLDISKTLLEVSDNAAHEQTVRRFQNWNPSPLLSPADWISVEDAGDNEPIGPDFHIQVIANIANFTNTEDITDWSWQLTSAERPIRRPSEGTVYEGIEEEHNDFHLAMTMVPATGRHYTEFTLEEQVKFTSGEQARARNGVTKSMSLKEARTNDHFPQEMLNRLSILRTNETDVELLSLDPTSSSVICRRIIEQVHRTDVMAPWDMHFGQRLSMLVHVPELSLVVVGSMCGRVALITLTELPDGEQPRRAFRVEHLLPRLSEDYPQKKLRPYCCLLGIAVSPVPEGRTKGLRLRRSDSTPARRWRLILHYMDHTILMYDIARSGDADMELIF